VYLETFANQVGMLLIVVALIATTLASAVWCTSVTLPRGARNWWQRGRPIAASGVLLAAVVAVAAGIRFLLVPAHHAMYVDEPWYAEAACNLMRLGRLVVCEETWSGATCVPYGKGWGWPVLISPWTLLVGCETTIGIQINRLLGAASVILVALASRLAGGGWRQSIIAAAILAIHPVHVAWSATAETNISGATMLLIGLCGALFYLRSGRLCGAALAASGLGLAAAIRPESFVPGLVAAVTLAWIDRAALGQRLLVAGGIIAACAAGAASGLELWSMNESISGGAFLSVTNIAQSLRLMPEGDLWAIHGVVVLLALAGVAAMAASRRWNAAWLLSATATSGALVVLAYDRFHQRMLLGPLLCLLPLCGFAVDWRLPTTMATRTRALVRWIAAASAVLLLGLLWWPELLAASFAAESQRLETRIAAHVGRLPFPADALFIAEQPPVLAATGMTHVMATERALDDEERLRQVIATQRPVYFLCDMYCEAGFQGAATPSRCNQMLGHFALAPVAEERLNSRTYGLYRVTGPLAAGAAPLGCPRSRN
jgi:hypothetical protein